MRINVADFGAVGDGFTMNTGAFEAAVRACSEAGGGWVSVPAGRFLSGTIELLDNVYLELTPGSVILASPNEKDFRGTQRGCEWHSPAARRFPDSGYTTCLPHERPADNPCVALVLAENRRNTGVIGPGMLDGGRGSAAQKGSSGLPFLAVFSHCTDVLLENVTMMHPGSFTNYLLGCERVTIRGLHIDSTGSPCGDGIDFDGGREVLISDCHIDAGDDGISLKTLNPDEPCEYFCITNCVIRSQYWGCIRIGPETVSDFRHITVSNCVFRDSNDGLKLQLCENRVFEDFVFTGLVMDHVTRPFFITNTHFTFGRRSPHMRDRTGTMRRMIFSDISAVLGEKRDDPLVGPYTPYSGCVLYSLPDGVIDDLTFSHVRLTCPGGGTEQQAARTDQPDLLDFVEQYPESCLSVGTPPAAAFYMRNASHIFMDDVAISCIRPDARCAVAAEEIDGLLLRDVRTANTGGLLRAHHCTTKGNCSKDETVFFTARQAADYDRARAAAKALDEHMRETADLIDCLSGTPDLIFDGCTGGQVKEEGILYLPWVRGNFRVEEDGREIACRKVPEEYCTATCFACRISRAGTVRVIPENPDEKVTAGFYGRTKTPCASSGTFYAKEAPKS